MAVLSKILSNTAITHNAFMLASVIVLTYWTSLRIVKARARRFAKLNNGSASKKGKTVKSSKKKFLLFHL